MAVAAAEKPARMPWGILLIQGIVAVIIGIFLWTNPLRTANLLVFFIAVYWLVTGVISIVRIFTERGGWVWKLIMGVIGILAGLILIQNPVEGTIIFGMTVVLILAIQGLIMGVISLIEAFQGGGWGPGIVGALSIIFGILLLGNVGAATMVLPWVVGVFMIVGGIIAIIMSFRLRRAA